MTVKIKINANFRQQDYFSEDSTIGVARVGRSIDVPTSTSKPLSGVKKTFSDSTRNSRSRRTRSSSQSPANEQDATFSNKIRQGVEVRGVFDLESDFLPYISVGNKKPYPVHYKEKLVPSFDEDMYGVLEKINRKNYLAFDDINIFSPVKRLNITNVNTYKMYPVFTGSHYNDSFEFNGSLEPFEIRKRRHDRRMIDTVTHVSDRGFFSGVRGRLMGGGFEESERGTVFIKDVYEILDKTSTVRNFDDTRHVNRLTTTHLPINFKESSGKVLKKPFDDRSEHSTLVLSNESYGFMTTSQINTLYSESIKSISQIGKQVVSATAGFVYESTTIGKTTSGTDSIAFGGFSQEKLNIQQTITTLLSYSLPS